MINEFGYLFPVYWSFQFPILSYLPFLLCWYLLKFLGQKLSVYYLETSTHIYTGFQFTSANTPRYFLKPERQYTRIYFSVTFGFASLYLFYINARPWDQYLQGPLFPSRVRFLQVTGSHLSSCCCLHVTGTQHVCLALKWAVWWYAEST